MTTARIASSPSLLAGFGGDAGFGSEFLGRNDDGSTSFVDATSIFENGINFFGTVYDGFFINNNGSITFLAPRSTYTPDVITGVSNNPEITPFFGDVDTRNSTDIGDPTEGGNSTGSNLVYWHMDSVGDRIIITWDDVGFYQRDNSLLNAFQLVISDEGNGDFDFQFRYEDINWTTGNASGGTDGLGGTPARAGWTAGTGVAGEFFELPQSGDESGILALDITGGNTGLTGIWEFQVRNGGVVESEIPRAEVEAGGWVTGDPHLLTLDGMNYSFQAVGEYVLLRSTRNDYDFEIQARFVPAGVENVSQTQAIATAIDGQEITIDPTWPGDTPLLINGTPINVADFGSVNVGNGRIYREGDTYTIVYPGSDGVMDGSDTQVAVIVRGDRVDMNLAVSAEILGDLEGLLGDGDGRLSNDVALADGTPLSSGLPFDELYGQFRDDWRVTTTTQSLFTYLIGFGPNSHYDPDYPGEVITLADLDPAVVAAAQIAVQNAGIPEGTPNYDNAVLDYALTGDTTFIESAAQAPVGFDDGTEAADFLTGTDSANRMFALGGNDTLYGQGGDDTLRGGTGQDFISAGDGADEVFGDGGNDTIFGEAGDDFLRGGREFDEIYGGSGNDQLRGQRHGDLMRGDAGNDNVNGGGGQDSLYGGIGDDFVKGGTRQDLLDGGDGNDTLIGNRHNDTLDGGAGDDTLNGGGDDDLLVGGTGNDTMKGGAGADVFRFNEEDGTDVIVDFDVTQDRLELIDWQSVSVVVLDDGIRFSSFGANSILLEGLDADDVASINIDHLTATDLF
ncbi:nidogen-like domain-containing protein [Tropicibacter naphthalenivorans]|uniref:Hemolysin IA n=1 Tax=Tropicibacter naphthalenivorans TaxID=441103 RepID=A0A0N7M180_9RHOB|nr:nidogen-like domain-containing protein [Tropicibacter naphthalenivorans]CUH82521.1 Hemolysin IA [Tropicibacter naphthalenivorans]SMD10662.1 Hemolysin-type calcium-binding repeat-containing protein [Tropicibacter naphthalenivorans]